VGVISSDDGRVRLFVAHKSDKTQSRNFLSASFSEIQLDEFVRPAGAEKH
jgi:hypothetical protein